MPAPVDGALDASASVDAEARQLAAIVESSQDAIIGWSLAGLVTSWNEGAVRLLGFARDEMLGVRVVDLWGPEERPRFDEVVEQLAEGRGIARYEGARMRKDRTFVDVSVTLSPIKGPDGDVIGVASVLRDISAFKRAQELLIEERNRWAGAFQGAPFGMALVGLDGGFLAVNRALCRLLGRDEERLLATDFQALSHPGDLDNDLSQLDRLVTGEIERYEIEKRYFRPGGEVVWASLSVSLVRDVHGEPAYFVSQLQDVTARKDAEAELTRYSERLSELARRDPLTGLRNHRDFHTMLDVELARARRGGRTWSLAMFRVDGLAEINDRDRARGERLVCQAAEAIVRAARVSDLAARIGDGEFALILPDTERQDARAAADRIAAAVRQAGIGAISYGLASWPADGESTEPLLRTCGMRLELSRRSALATPRVVSADDDDPQSTGGSVHRIVSLARAHLGMDVAYLGRIEEAGQTLTTVCDEQDSFEIMAGESLVWDETYCRLMLAGTVPNAVPAVVEELSLNSLGVTERLGIGSYIGVPVRLANGHLYGTLCALSHDPPPRLGDAEVKVMQSLADLLASEIERDVHEISDRRSEVELAGVHALLSALDARDHYTSEHSKTVVALATRVARETGLDAERTRDVERVALLHDIGKVGIPDSILQKRGPLNDQEWELMRQHPSIGARILAATLSLARFAAAVNAEHERFDGTGYPDGLSGEAIPLASRIAFACDAYHAMTSDRPYRAAMDPSAAQAEMRAGAGNQFDPEVVAALLAVLSDGRSERTPSAARRTESDHRDVLTADTQLQALTTHGTVITS
jgi:PAS domain S-box-containing protein/diguanylate cyclase (GGDEF)-like protein/putative nucleotidyltransferase with HDIG domain